MLVIVIVVAGAVGAGALVCTSAVTGFYYRRLPPRFPLQIGLDGGLLGVAPRRTLFIIPAILGFALILHVLGALNTIRPANPSFSRIAELSVSVLVAIALMSLILAAHNIAVVRITATGRKPPAAQLASICRSLAAIAFAAMGLMIWAIFDVSRRS